jgi:hypothetical protein
LLRQINPSWIQQSRVTSQAFRPTPKDDRRLSVYDGDQVTPEEAWEHYAETLGHSSVGVLAVSVEECLSLALPVESDPAPFPAHAIVSFSGVPGAQVEAKAKLLRRAAEVRGWQYQVEAQTC